MSGTIYGSVRVSTERQDTGSDAQRHALEAAGCGIITEEQASGRKARPMLAELVDRLEPGDVRTVYRFDRSAARSPTSTRSASASANAARAYAV